MKTLILALGLLVSSPAFSIDTLTDANFQQATENLTGIVYYYADWCPYCTKFAPTLEKLEKEFPELKFTKLNIDENRQGEFANTVPLVAFYSNGRLIGTVKGYAPEADVRAFFKNFVKKFVGTPI